MKETYCYYTWENLPLEVSFYPAANREAGITLIYFHGGGLIYGDRDDLPSAYIKQLTDSGNHLLTVDYPLAPEASLKSILLCVEQSLTWFKAEFKKTLELTNATYCLFGRSAGAYLSLLFGNHLQDPDFKGIISFYGYYTLNEPSFNQASSYYQKYPAIPFMTVYQLTQGLPKAHASIQERFPIYLSYRQTGQWVKQLLGKDEAENFSLTDKDLQQLPPTFLAASDGDQDVPYALSERMARLIPESFFYHVTNLPHDFDTDSTQPAGKKAYTQLIQWLNKLA